MNKEIIQTAIRNGTLRKYDLTKAQAGDKVFGWEPGEVLSVYGEEVVIGWDMGDRKSVSIYRTHHAPEIYLAPLNINGHLVPAPEREPLPNGTKYYVPWFFDDKAAPYTWYDARTDHRLLNSGLIHLTEEAANAHAEALLSFTNKG